MELDLLEGSDELLMLKVEHCQKFEESEVRIDVDNHKVGMDVDAHEVGMDLTDDLWHMVFSLLDNSDLGRAAMVCREWRSASSHEDLWKCLNFEGESISIRQIEDVCRRFPNATEVHLRLLPKKMLALEALTSLRNLETLKLGKGSLGWKFCDALGRCSTLKSLIIKDSRLDSLNEEIRFHHDRLKHLNINISPFYVYRRISFRCHNLETLSLNQGMWLLAMFECPQLLELNLSSCYSLSDAEICSAVKSCPLLTSLNISKSTASDRTLGEIGLACSNLRVLNASECEAISFGFGAVKLPKLKVLKLHKCGEITSASMIAISHSYMLEVLELDNCHSLKSISLTLAYLRRIRLMPCTELSDLNLESPLLESVEICDCPSHLHINIRSNSFPELILNNHERLATLEVQCYSLQEVELSKFNFLTDSVSGANRNKGGGPMRGSLVLDKVENLKEVRFSSTSLVKLSLDNCRALTFLDLKCPYLEELNLEGCDHLRQASFSFADLRSLNLGMCQKLEVLQIYAPQMVSLELKGCSVLAEASINCPGLINLDASFCSQLKDDILSATTVSCLSIQSMNLASCQSVGPAGLSSLRLLSQLTRLDLSYTFLTNLWPVYESCLQLEVLELQACKHLEDSALEPLYKEGALPFLCELDLSHGSLCQSSIEEILVCCTRLTKLRLDGYTSMHDLNWGCKSVGRSGSSNLKFPFSISSPENKLIEEPSLLQSLQCVGCPNIKKVVIPTLARCFHLSSLNLSLTVKLEEVDISSFNLCFLNLSNCYALKILKLKCPRLRSLFLQASLISEEELLATVSQCNMLSTLDVRNCPKVNLKTRRRLLSACPSLQRIFTSLSPQ